jgi:N-acetylmuramoyl-L-alanine amidase
MTIETPLRPVSPEPSQPSAPALGRKFRPLGVLSSTILTAILLATFFTSFTPSMFSTGLRDQMAVLLTSQPEKVSAPGTPRPKIRIGIVSGHWGNDSGAVCENGTTEADVNLKIATLVQQKLGALGYETDLLKEFDPRLTGYQSAVLVSIHNDSCGYINDQATGFKVAAAMSSRDNNLANRLAACLRDRYQRATGLPLHNSVTNDMSLYHAFNEIDAGTSAAIIETGFLNLDYQFLTGKTDLVATGVANGILCFVNNENIIPTVAP